MRISMTNTILCASLAPILAASLFTTTPSFAAETPVPVPDSTATAPESDNKGNQVVEEKEVDDSIGDRFFGLDIYSAYVWRGLLRTDEPVWQPGILGFLPFIENNKLYLGLKANFNMTPRAHHNQFAGLDEIVYVVGYEMNIDSLILNIGHSWRTYPADLDISDTFWVCPVGTEGSYDRRSREINFRAKLDNEYVVPFVELDFDYAEVEGVYGLAGLRKEIQIEDRLTIGAEVSLGAGTNPYTDYYFGNNSKNGLVDGNIALHSKFSITDNAYIGAKLVFTSLMDSDLQDADSKYDSQDNCMIWGGLSLGIAY